VVTLGLCELAQDIQHAGGLAAEARTARPLSARRTRASLDRQGRDKNLDGKIRDRP